MYTPLHPLLYSKIGVYRGKHYFLIFAPKHRLFIYVLSKNKKNITFFHMKIIIFTVVKKCDILHRRVFGMAEGLPGDTAALDMA